MLTLQELSDRAEIADIVARFSRVSPPPSTSTRWPRPGPGRSGCSDHLPMLASSVAEMYLVFTGLAIREDNHP